MPDLTAKFSAEDKISDRIESIAQAGMSMVEQFERAGDVASAAFDGMEGSARKAMAGAATGKYVVGGAAGATVGALAAISPRLVISYTSEGKSKSITLDTAASGTFASKVVKDFQQTHTQKRSTIEL